MYFNVGAKCTLFAIVVNFVNVFFFISFELKIYFENLYINFISSTNNWRCGGKTVNRSQPWRGQQNWRHGEKSETKAGKSDEASITLKLHSLKQESVAYFDQIQNTFRVCEMFVMLSG